MSVPLTWKPIKRPEFSLMNSISNLVHQVEASQGSPLTSVRNGPNLILCCDFSGQHSSAKYECYSFLLADSIYLWLWDEFRKKLRIKYLPQRRRVSFKNLNDRYRQKALIPFLRASNCIPGVLFSFLIDKNIESLFEKKGKLDLSDPEYKNYKHWKPSVFEKILRIAHFGSLILACMSAPNQNILWISDEDEIAPNKKRLVEVCKIFEHHSNHYLPHLMGKSKFGTAQCDDGSLFIEDLLAIPDLVAGTLCELAPGFSNKACELENLNIFKEQVIQYKSTIIMNWLMDPIHTLKKIIIRLEAIDGEINIRCISGLNKGQYKEFFWHEDFKELINKS